MLRRRVFLLWAFLAGIAIAGLAPPARATFELYVQEYTAAGVANGAAVVFTSTPPFTAEPVSGTGVLMGATGTTPSFAFSLSASQNANGSGVPSLHLDTFSIGTSISTSNYLVVGLSEGGAGAGYHGPIGGPVISNLSSIALIGNATVTFQSFADANNNLFGVPVGSFVPPTSGAPANPFSPPLTGSAGAVGTPIIVMDATNSSAGITTSTNFNATGDFSLTSVATIHGLAAGQSISFNGVTSVTPAPAGLLLALSGLPAAGLYYLRRRKVATPA